MSTPDNWRLSQYVQDTETPEEAQRYRELVIQNLNPGTQRLSLVLMDTRFADASADEKDYLLIPLGAGIPTVAGDSPRPQSPEAFANYVIPIIPKRYATARPDQAQAQELRPGWLYIYRNGYLWRELEVLNQGHLRDVNLKAFQGQDLRPATGQADSRVIVPYQIAGEPQQIEIAYSEVQWSWARVNAMGGMNPDPKQEPRLLPGTAMPEDQDKDPARYRRERMQDITDGLDRWMKGEDTESIQSVEKVTAAIYSLNLHKSSKLPVVFLHDPLGIAANYVDAFFTVERELVEVIEGLPQLESIAGRDGIKGYSADEKQAYYRAAVLAYRTFFDPKLTKGSREFLVKGKVTWAEADTLIGKAARELDKAYLEEILAVEQRRELRARIREIKRIYVEFLEGRFDGQDIGAAHPDFVDINAALLDFASLEGVACIRLWDKVKDLIGFLNHDPGVLDSAHDIASLVAAERPRLEDDPGNRYLESLLDPAHPLHKALFPSAEQIDIYTADMDLDLDHGQQPEPADGSGDFRPASFAAALAASRRPPMGVAKDLKNILAQSEKIVADIVSSFQRQWQQALINGNTVRTEPLLRLVKGAKIPELAGMHIARAGSDLDGQIVVDGKLRIMEVLNRHQRRAASAATGKVAEDYISIVDPRTGAVIGSQKISDLGNFRGASPRVTDQSWTELWGKSGKVGNQFKILRTHADLVVVPETSPYVVKYHNPDAVSSSDVGTKVKALRGLSKTLPPLVAVMEGWNLWKAVSAIRSIEDINLKSATNGLFGTIALLYATADAAVKIGGEDAVAHRLASYGNAGRIGSRIVKGTMKIFGEEIKIFGVAGAGVAGLSAVMSAWEMAESIQLNDEDAALGHGIAMAGSAGVAMAGLGSSGVTMLAFLGPYGWAFLGIAILGSVLAYVFADTDLEKWVKLGPFSADQETRMSHEYAGKKPQYVLERFMGMLMQPSMTMKKDVSTRKKDGQGNSIPDIVVEVIAPGFEPDLSTLDVRATIEEGEIDVRGHHAALTRLSGNQKSQTPYGIEQLYADENSQQVIGVRYRYRAPGPHLVCWRARARHITKDQIILPPVLDAPNITSDGLMASPAPTGQTASTQQSGTLKGKDDGVRIIDTVPGWVYAKLN